MKKLFIILSVIINTSAFAADTVNDFAFWQGIMLNKNFNEHFGFYLEGQNRVSKNTNSNNAAMFRTALKYYLVKDVTLFAGYGFMPQMTPFRSEHRIWEAVQWAPKFSDIETTFRARLEQRFLANAPSASHRLRLLARAMGPICKDDGINWVLWNEYMINFNAVSGAAIGGFNQNRAFAGPAFVLGSHARLEVGYLNQYIRRTEALGDLMSHVIATYLYIQ